MQQCWKKLGRIFAPDNNYPWMRSHAAVPIAVHLKGNLYRIYFSSRDHYNRSKTGFLEINLNYPEEILHITDKPVLEVGMLGTFDDSGAMGCWITGVEEKLYMYYIGWNLGGTVPFRNSIGLAISNDRGKTFVKFSMAPVLDRNEYDPYFVASACVRVEEDLWKMWYLSCVKWEHEDGKPKHYYNIKYAESDDGVAWTRKGIVCIDFKSEDEYAISRPCVLKDEDIYKMWYSYRGESYRIGFAESKDGIEWERKDEEVGLDFSETGWDSEMIEYPFVFDNKGKRYMLYNGNGYGKTGIGLAVLDK